MTLKLFFVAVVSYFIANYFMNSRNDVTQTFYCRTETQVPLRYLSCIPQHDKRGNTLCS